MSTLGIVFLSLFGGMCLVLLLALAIYLGWSGYKLDRLVRQLQTDFPALLASHSAEMKLQQELLRQRVAAINGEQLAESSRAATIAARRIETAAVAFADLAKHLLSEEALAVRTTAASGLGGEDFAPPDAAGAPFITQSRTARGDGDALRRAAVEDGEGALSVEMRTGAGTIEE